MGGLTTKIELNGVIVSVEKNTPNVLIDPGNSLPSGPLETEHRTLEQGLRAWAGLPLGYVEQLYTFADSDRTKGNQRIVSIGYLALMRAAPAPKKSQWSSWYAHFPWEDNRDGPTNRVANTILPALQNWKNSATNSALKKLRGQRIEVAFPKNIKFWNEEMVLQRYELLWEAGLVEEARRGVKSGLHHIGLPMAHDHRRILATAIARLRAKIKYRPVVFELMPDSFTLFQLQNTVEALSGLRLHKQNFRRLVVGQRLVEETKAITQGASGRPAKLFAFRREVLQERALAGTKLPRTS